MRIVLFLSIALLVVSVFLPWMGIDSKGIAITGWDTTGTDFGRPGAMHLLLATLTFLLMLRPNPWLVRAVVFIAAFNAAWAIRNYIVLSACSGGICPERQYGLYLSIAASLLLLAMVVLTPIGRQRHEKRDEAEFTK